MSDDITYDDDFAGLVDEDTKNNYLVQDTVVFIFDGTRQMHDSNYFRKCLKAYNRVVRNKCSFNKKDKLGVIVFGTKDTNCQVNNITLLQKFEAVTVDSLKNVQSILNGGIDKYKELALDSNEKYPLYDALEYAFQTANSSKTNNNSEKIIILCTCKSDPPADERRRVEHLVATFKDTNTKLWVIGLTGLYDENIFYKDLQILSGSFDNDNYQSMCLRDLDDNILHISRSIGKLPWKISPDIVVQVSLLNLVSASKYASKVKLNKSTNEILEARAFMREVGAEADSVLDDSEEPTAGGEKVVTSDKFVYYKYFGGEDIHFTPDERRKIKNADLTPGIEVLAFKPVYCDPIYHCKNTYFVTYSKDANEDTKNFFTAFVSRCTAKKVMPICKVITKNSVMICNMIPSDDDGGFYMYKIPYSNYVRDFDVVLQAYKYDEDNKCPINNRAVKLFKELTAGMEVEFDSKEFSNPKLQKIVTHLEALALDNELRPLPHDSTRPPPLQEKLQTLKTALMNLLELRDVETARKRPLSQKPGGASKKAKGDSDIPTLARENKLNIASVTELKAYLESVGIAPKGIKSVLIEKVKQHVGV